MSRVKVGVFVCHCGSNIGGTVDVPNVVEYAKDLPLVHYAEDNLYTCSDAGLTAIKKKIKEHGLNRVVVASCTPRTHEELFRRTCEEAGVNRYLFEFVNLREHCSWIHMNQPQEATCKAKELVRLGAAKAARLRPLEISRAPVKPACLVIGGGVAGLAAAGSLAQQGFEVHLVERDDRLGGLTGDLWKLLPGDRPASELLHTLTSRVTGEENVTVYLNSELDEITGFIGSFKATLSTPSGKKDIDIGTVIVATGAVELEPLGLYHLGETEGVITQMGLEKMLADEKKDLGDVVFINCVGARGPDREYCGRLCCAVSIKNARYLKEADPDARVTVLQRDVMAFGTEFETEYRKAMCAGVRFIRFSPERPPTMIGKDKVTGVRIYNQLTGEESDLSANTVVLTTPLAADSGASHLAQMLKVPIDKEGFFLEAHLKLRPVEFATDGVFIAGAARFPADIGEAVAQGTAAAAKAAAPMFAGEVSVEATTAVTNQRLCSGCGTCEAVCPFGAIEITPDRHCRPVSDVNAVMCKGCGACAAACPCGAIQQLGFTDSQIFEMVRSLARDGDPSGPEA